MEDFVYDHFLAIFGAKKMAEKYLHGFIVGVRALAEEEATRCTVFGAPPHVFTRGCSPMHQKLQPCAPEAASPMHQKLQASRHRRAAPRAGGCRCDGGGGGGALLCTLRGAPARSLQQQCTRGSVP